MHTAQYLEPANENDISFEDLFDIEDIQRLQDEFSDATGVASIITHTDGTPITRPSNFCRLCSELIRDTEKGCHNCFNSDAYIGRSCKDGPIIQPCLSGGLWDAGAGINVGGKHIANWLIGQVRDETQSEDKIRAYAREIGADENEMAEAFNEVTSMSLDQFDKISKMLYTLANQLSEMAYQNIQKARYIIEKAKAEEALENEKENLTVTLKSIADGVVTTDTKGHIIILNKAAERLTEWSAKEALGLNIIDVLKIQENNTGQPCCRKIVEEVLEKSITLTLANQTTLISRYGKHISISCNAAPIFNSQSEVIGLVLVFRDITAQKKLEESIQNSKKLDSLGILAGGLAHDFNNLLSGIFGYIELAMRKSSEPSIMEYLSQSLSNIDKAKILTKQLLTFSKGGTPIRKTQKLNSFIKQTVEFALKDTTVSCSFNIQNNLWKANYDQYQIGQVLDNITTNAQQAMEKGGTLEITAENKSFNLSNKHPYIPEGNYIKIEIKDDGCGISSEELPQIFDPYYTTKEQGRGLGLSTCYSIIKKHNGWIDVESRVGIGSKFIIYLPAADRTINNQLSSNIKHTGKGIFLVMDDEEDNLNIMKIRLESFGYDVVLTKNGVEAVEYFKQAKAKNKNIVGMIFDITVPGGMGGRFAISEIRKIDHYTPAFVASGYSSDPIIANPKKYGFTASISKPFMTNELAGMLEKYI